MSEVTLDLPKMECMVWEAIRSSPLFLQKTNKKRIVDYPNLWGFIRDVYQTPGVAETVDQEHIMKHYYVSHRTINTYGIVPVGPTLDMLSAHGREKLAES